MTRSLILAFTALALVACGGSSGDGAEYAAEPMPAPSMHQAAQKYKSGGFDADEGAPAPEPADGTSSQQFIAYTHALGLSLPKPAVEPMFNAHMEACRAAGPARCLVSNSNLHKQDEDRVYGELYLRATEDWITEFNAALDGDVAAAKGDITSRNSSAVNLTTQIIDTDAQLQAQVTLRNRLLELLENRDGKLADFLEIERELARVTGTINSIEANLKALKDRVALSNFTISYQPKISSLAPSQFEPLGDAFSSFFYNLSRAVASVVTAFAVGLPWMILIGLMIWIWLRLIWPRIRRKKKTG